MRYRFFSSLILLAVLLAACAPATSTVAPAQPEIEVATVSPSPVPAGEMPTVDATATPSDAAQPIATSRGPDLEATDPATVSLASGGLQLVEFFRFT